VIVVEVSTGPQKLAMSRSVRAVAGSSSLECHAIPPQIQPCTAVSAASAMAPKKNTSRCGAGSCARIKAAKVANSGRESVSSQSQARTFPSLSRNQAATAWPLSPASGGEPSAIAAAR
jgi:hypothetical protein